jgi:hypothetical protein
MLVTQWHWRILLVVAANRGGDRGAKAAGRASGRAGGRAEMLVHATIPRIQPRGCNCRRRTPKIAAAVRRNARAKMGNLRADVLRHLHSLRWTAALCAVARSCAPVPLTSVSAPQRSDTDAGQNGPKKARAPQCNRFPVFCESVRS